VTGWRPVRRIPIYDAIGPITCTIDDQDVSGRIELIERMRRNLEHINRTEHGLLLTFPDRDDVEADVRNFALLEKDCCRFWGFGIEATDHRVQLRWDGPPATHELLDSLLAYFTGDEPITAIAGLWRRL
jgi:hypothetical protein